MNRKFGILLAVYLSALAINLDVTIVNVALPSISQELEADTSGLQWVVDGYNLSFAALVLAAGSLSDRYGRRPALLVGLLGFAATSILGAVVDSTGALIAARVGMGVFAALIFPTTLSIIANTFPDRRQRAAALGGWGAVVASALPSAPSPADCSSTTSTGAACSSAWRRWRWSPPPSRSHWCPSPAIPPYLPWTGPASGSPWPC